MGIDNSPLNHVQRPNTFHVSAPNHGANFSIHGPSSLSHPNSLLWATSSKLWIFWRFKSPRWQSNVPNIAQFTAASGWSSHLAYESRNHHSPSQAAAPFGSALWQRQGAYIQTASPLHDHHSQCTLRRPPGPPSRPGREPWLVFRKSWVYRPSLLK